LRLSKLSLQFYIAQTSFFERRPKGTSDTPEELQFGITNPSNNDFIQIWPNFADPDEYMKQITKMAQENRHRANQKARAEIDRQLTYRNKNRREKLFSVGQIVLHRQLQVSTGTGGALRPLFTGPYVVQELDEDESSAVLEHLHTHRHIKAHFTNLQKFNYDPSVTRLPSNFESQFTNIEMEKDSQAKYNPSVYENRKKLNNKHRQRLTEINNEYNKQNQLKINYKAPSKVRFNEEANEIRIFSEEQRETETDRERGTRQTRSRTRQESSLL